jgi:hypothetical protein
MLADRIAQKPCINKPEERARADAELTRVAEDWSAVGDERVVVGKVEFWRLDLLALAGGASPRELSMNPAS